VIGLPEDLVALRLVHFQIAGFISGRSELGV
jgi:hypothetical protein